MSNKTYQIIIPVDFGEQSLIAVSQSFNMAKLTNSELTLLHVIDNDLMGVFQSKIFSKSDLHEQHMAGVKQQLEELAAQIRQESGVKVNTRIMEGKIYDAIVDVSAEDDAGLIIMGTMGAVGLKKKILGSNASRVVREAVCPVITIKGKEHRFGIKHILLPLDLTKETKEKVNKAINIARMFGSVIHIVTIVESGDEFITNKLTRQMDQVSDHIQEAGITCTTEFVEGGDVVDEILKVADKTQSDLIMIMTQQEVGFTDLFISSAAQEVINRSEVPVLSIRPMPRKDTTTFTIQ
ncbi:MAG: universal stress protein [Bacteroidota bacterium]